MLASRQYLGNARKADGLTFTADFFQDKKQSHKTT